MNDPITRWHTQVTNNIKKIKIAESPALQNNHTIGTNLATFRKLRHKKAWEVAEYVQLKEAAYTKYERGESKITIELVQKVAELLQVNPLRILLADPDHYIESIEAPLMSDPSETLKSMLEILKQINVTLQKFSESLT